MLSDLCIRARCEAVARDAINDSIVSLNIPDTLYVLTAAADSSAVKLSNAGADGIGPDPPLVFEIGASATVTASTKWEDIIGFYIADLHLRYRDTGCRKSLSEDITVAAHKPRVTAKILYDMRYRMFEFQCITHRSHGA